MFPVHLTAPSYFTGLQGEEVLPQMTVLSIEEIEKQSIEVAIKKLGAGIMGYRK